MNVFEYMGIEPETTCDHVTVKQCSEVDACYECKLRINSYPEKDGNLMVLCINKMREKGDIEKFDSFIYTKYSASDANTLTTFLFNNFFKLMEEWLREL